MDKIIFLDIDGPMIPDNMFFVNEHASLQRCISPISVAIINRLCEKTDAKIVTNSTHNYYDIGIFGDTGNLIGSRDLRTDLIAAGIKEEFIHSDWRTIYSASSHDRKYAIDTWLEKNTEENAHAWICFDDLLFTEDKRLILVNSEHGISYENYNRAINFLLY